MIEIKKKDILSAYNFFKKAAVSALEKSDIESSLEQIEVCAKLGYQFNDFYTDAELENILFANGEKIYNSSNYDNIIAIKGRYAFIDTNGSDNHGLTQQYIRALISAQVEFVYIYEEVDLGRIKIILEDLEAYPKATIFTFDKDYPLVQRTRMIMEFLEGYRPEKYFMHIMPWDVVAVLVCNLLKGVVRYNINATDHAYWLGASCIDYCIEFRNYGYSVSIDKRGLRPEQLLLLPYYPIINRIDFNGFPDSMPKSSVKIFSGGSYYKIYGEDGIYFKIIKRLLTENPNAVLLYAGSGNSSKLEKFVADNNLQQRIFLLGNRNDIQEVFEASDIYLATYPISGGLMSQYAAINGRAILAYTDPKLTVNLLESTVCHQSYKPITHTDLETFYNYGHKLCHDEEYRISEGADLKKNVITPDLFNEEFKYLLCNDKSKREPHFEEIDYDKFFNLYLEVENRFQPFSQRLIASKLKFKTIYIFPKIFINVIIIMISKFLNSK